ncbi:ribonuclease H-like protein [Trametopsis cervina]|nr:ribonuclease H-like protein [Trametopsis cervina]
MQSRDEAVQWLAMHGVRLPDGTDTVPSASISRMQVPTTSNGAHTRTSTPSASANEAARAGPRKDTRQLSETNSPSTSKGALAVLTPRIVYCDGACRGNGKQVSIAGVGVYWGLGDPRNIAERCPGVQTNNRAELIAIIRVLETDPVDYTPLIIRTDSKYCIQCLHDWLPRWRRNGFRTGGGKPVSNKELICYIDALLVERKKFGQKVTFEHVRGHSGDVGNDGADGQANLGCELPAEPDRDWALLEQTTRDRIADAQTAMEQADEEGLIEAMSDDKPMEEPAHQEDLPEEYPVTPVVAAAQLPATPPKQSTSTLPSPKKSPFKPAKRDTPQFTGTPRSPRKPAPAPEPVPELTEEDLASYADCLGDVDELEAELMTA